MKEIPLPKCKDPIVAKETTVPDFKYSFDDVYEMLLQFDTFDKILALIYILNLYRRHYLRQALYWWITINL